MADDKPPSPPQKRKLEDGDQAAGEPSPQRRRTDDDVPEDSVPNDSRQDKSRKDRDREKAKAHKFGNKSVRHGSQKHKKGDMGRGEHPRNRTDRRARNEGEQDRRQRVEAEGKEYQLPAPFSAEEIAAEERKPKSKVAVLIGYSGTGYRGLQINYSEKTIEGDLFKAFIEAGAISKANANDPKKSQLVRCARTDKGVHAAGNVLSLKLIIEDKDIVEKINAHLSPQIRVWGILRTVNSFNSYQACDSRQYEYLIPTHSFILPHSSSWLAKRLEEHADETNDREGYESRQAEMKGWWERVEEEQIKPVIERIPDKFRAKVVEAMYDADHVSSFWPETEAEKKKSEEQEPMPLEDRKQLEAHVKELRNAYRSAKRAFRLPAERFARIQPILDKFIGTKNYHNYTVEKTYKDPSSNRIIKSFKVNPERLVIDGTEWLSVKIWGQSFMMHQIRKMMGMVALVVRCGTDPARVDESFGRAVIALPKAPSVGLLLERPLFTSYNEKQAAKFGRDELSFAPYEAEMAAFKQREIYERVYREEDEENAFHAYFAHVDNWRTESFLWLTSMGFDAVARERARREAAGQPVALAPDGGKSDEDEDGVGEDDDEGGK